MTDPIADMLTRIRNASKALLPEVEIPHSKIKENIGTILQSEGYVASSTVKADRFKTIHIKLKYNGREGVIAGIKRISKPGLRRYAASQDIPRVLGGLGIAIVSTPKGVMTGNQARRENLGGEVLCYVW